MVEGLPRCVHYQRMRYTKPDIWTMVAVPDFFTEPNFSDSARARSSSLVPSSVPLVRGKLPAKSTATTTLIAPSMKVRASAPPTVQDATGVRESSEADSITLGLLLKITRHQMDSIPRRGSHSRAGSREPSHPPRGRSSSRASEPPARTSQRAKSRQPQAARRSSRHRPVAPKSLEKRKQQADVVSDGEDDAPPAKRPRYSVYDQWQHDDLEVAEEIPKEYLLSV